MKQIYLDNNATTPLDKRALDAMMPYLTEHYGNASSVHDLGREAKTALENSREKIAELFNAEPSEIYFTSGGTESDNIALQGTAYKLKSKKDHVIVSNVEHHAILETANFLEKDGFRADYLGVDSIGKVSTDELKNKIDDQTSIVSVMHSNNEVGTLQPIKELTEIAHANGALFHTDAVCSTGKVKIDVQDLGVDLLSMSGHKIYGPKGVGVIYIHKGVRIRPVQYGGHHEKGRRPGTEYVAGAVGLAKAMELCHENMEEQHAKYTEMADLFIDKIQSTIPDVLLNGPKGSDRLPSTINLSFNGIEGESIILSLDMKGVAVASGSACTSGSLDASHVLTAMSVPIESAQGSIRFSMGRFTEKEDIIYTADCLPEIIERLRAMSPIYNKE